MAALNWGAEDRTKARLFYLFFETGSCYVEQASSKLPEL